MPSARSPAPATGPERPGGVSEAGEGTSVAASPTHAYSWANWGMAGGGAEDIRKPEA